MSNVQKHDGLDRTATQWVVRLTSGNASDRDLDAARSWCRQSRDHHAAFERASRLWRMAGPQLSQPRHCVRASHIKRLAAVIVLAVGIALLSIHDNWGADYRTPVGEQRRVQLEDGSSILLDSGTAVDVEYSANRRTIRLRKGQALFDVASDRERPFVVNAETLTATAVGTTYAVRRSEERAEVIVEEGRVAVVAPGVNPAVLTAGERFEMGSDVRSAAVKTVSTRDALAWQRGVLVFDLVPLEQVVAELNRHRRGYIAIANPDVRNLKVSGVFRLDRLDEGLDTLRTAFPVRMTELTPYLLILR